MKNWNDIKAGDSIFNTDGDEAKVLEVGASGKTFLRSWWEEGNDKDWETETWGWLHIERAKELGWTLGEAKKDKIQEFEEWLNSYDEVDYYKYDEIIAKVKELFGDK